MSRLSLILPTREINSRQEQHDQNASQGQESIVSNQRGAQRRGTYDNWCELRFHNSGPERRGYQSSFVHKDKLYIYGGHDINDKTFSNMWSLDLEKLRKFKMKFESKKMEAVVFNQNNSSFHGLSYESDLKFGWQLVNTKAKVREPKIKLELGPRSVAHHTSIVDGDSMYLIGGSNTKSENRGFFKLNMQNFTWELIEQLQNSRLVPSKYMEKGSKVLTRDGHSCCYSKEFRQMYIFGGFISGERTNQLIIYSLDGPMWSRVNANGPQPSARNGHSACIYNKCMYIFGGRNNDNKKLNDLWKYDILSQEWTEIEMINKDNDPTFCMPMERSGHSCDIYGQYMVIFGGFYEITKELNDLFLFDFINEKWIPIFIEQNSPLMQPSMNGPYNDTSVGHSMNVTLSQMNSQMNLQKPLNTTTSNQDNMTLQSTNFDIPNVNNPYSFQNKINSNRVKTSNSKRSSSSLIMNKQFLRDNSRTQNGEDIQKSTTITSSQMRKLSPKQSRFQIVKRQVLKSEFGRMNSQRWLDTSRGSELCYSQGYGIQLPRVASESSNYIKQVNHGVNMKLDPQKKKEDDEKKPKKIYDRQCEHASYYNSNQKNEAQFMVKNLKKVNPLNLKKQLDVKNLKDDINKTMMMKVVFNIKRNKEQDKSNVYGFKRELISSPTSLSMLNSIPLKNADVQKWDNSYQQMKKRRNIGVFNFNPGNPATEKTIPEEQEDNNFGQARTGEQSLEGIKTHTTPQSRDGHTGIIYKGLLIIFGGDRHHMPFNDTFVFDLATELRQINLPVPNE